MERTTRKWLKHYKRNKRGKGRNGVYEEIKQRCSVAWNATKRILLKLTKTDG